MDLYTLDAAGTPVPCADWKTWAAGGNPRLAFTPVGAGHVSTIFLGWEPPGRHRDPPLLFETMAIGIDGLDLEERYATKAEALAGHGRAVEVARHWRAVTEAEAATPPLDAA